MNYHQREFVAAYVKAGGSVPDAFELLKIAKSLTRLAEKHCNYGLTEREENREQGLVDTARVIATRAHMSVEHSGDPRGCALKLVTTEGRRIYVP